MKGDYISVVRKFAYLQECLKNPTSQELVKKSFQWQWFTLKLSSYWRRRWIDYKKFI